MALVGIKRKNSSNQNPAPGAFSMAIDITPKPDLLGTAEAVFEVLERLGKKAVLIIRWDDGMLQAWLPDNALQYCKTCEAEEVHQWTVNYLKEYYNIDASNIESSNTVFKIADKDREYLIVVVSEG